MSSFKNQGSQTSPVFAGRGTSVAAHALYGQSGPYFARLLRERLPVHPDPYVIADIGSHKGELWETIRGMLEGNYALRSIAIDANEAALAENPADEHVVADATALPLRDKSVDVAIMRYVLQWNSPEAQRQILREFARVISRAGIIQHAGSDPDSTDHRHRIRELLAGHAVPALHRGDDFYFSTHTVVETWMRKADIRFTRTCTRRINDLSDTFIERYALSPEDARRTKAILGSYDYIVQTTWVILPT